MSSSIDVLEKHQRLMGWTAIFLLFQTYHVEYPLFFDVNSGGGGPDYWRDETSLKYGLGL